MATGTQIPVEEYLRSVYRPDCDYVDGVLEERNVGEQDHSWVQSRFIILFHLHSAGSGIVAFPECRFQVGPNRFRVPDVVVTRGRPKEQILTSIPLLCIEILSPGDTVSRVNERVQDYLEFGVPVVWVVDPAERRLWIYRPGGLEEALHSVRLDGTSIEIPFEEIF